MKHVGCKGWWNKGNNWDLGIRLHSCIYHKLSCMKGSTTLSYKKLKGITNTNSSSPGLQFQVGTCRSISNRQAHNCTRNTMLCVVEVLKIKMVEVATCQLLLFELNLAGLKFLINSCQLWQEKVMRTKGRNKCEERNSLSNTTSKNETKLQLHLTATNKKQQKRIHAKFETNLISQWISKTLIGCTLASVSVVHNSIDKKLS